MSALADALRAEALRLGFARIGFAAATRPERDAEAFEAWLDRGDHASMGWMERTREVRGDPRHASMLEHARTVVVVAAPYGADAPVDLGPGRLARYARGRDYHRVLDKRLRKLAKVLEDAGHRVRHAVDTKPLLERAFAARAGIGFVGKNACVIVPGLGSHVFLGSLVTDAELPPDAPIRDGCGECSRCLDACPTDAFRAPRVLDARRCVSYLTIEHEGPIDPALRDGIGPWIFGCDACQDVCPYNAGRARSAGYDEAFEAHARFDALRAEDLIALDDARFDALTEGSPLRRSGRESMARNAAIVLGNVGERRHLPVLVDAREDASETVREAARWAEAKLRARLDQSSEPSSSSKG